MFLPSVCYYITYFAWVVFCMKLVVLINHFFLVLFLQRLNEARRMMDKLRACIVANYYASAGMAKPSEVHPRKSSNASVVRCLQAAELVRSNNSRSLCAFPSMLPRVTLLC